MQSFELIQAKARITSYNSRAETHGKEEVPAADIAFELKQPNTVLSHFGSQLRDSIYWASEAAKAEARKKKQGELDVGEVVTDKPNLRNPNLQAPLSVDFEGEGYVLVVDYGVGGRSNIELGDCRVNAIQFTPHEGGSVTLKLRVQRSDIGEKEAGRLSRMVKREVTIDLRPVDEALKEAA